MSPPAPSQAPPRVITRAQLARFQELVTGYCGLLLSEESRPRLGRVVNARMKQCALEDVDSYVARLEDAPGPLGELACLVDELTNNETYFFREEPQLEAFSEEILPELVLRAGRRRRLSLWSAGCSSGEEPLTLAMLLVESPLWSERLSSLAVHILGTDVCRPMIRRSREGRYGASSFKGLRPARRREIQRRFFLKEGEQYLSSPELRQIVSYLHLNLLDPEGAALFGEMDGIFCRNVLMYFPAALRLPVLQIFFRKLSPGGYLLLGHSENLLGLETPFEALRQRGSLVYRKPDRWRTGPDQGWGG